MICLIFCLGKTENIWDHVVHYKKHLMIPYTFVGHENATNEYTSTTNLKSQNAPITKWDKIKSYTLQWTNKNNNLKKSLEKITSPVHIGIPKLFGSKKTESEPTIDNDIPDRPRKIIDYYHGVPIYEPLPVSLLRKVTKLPSENEMSNDDIYTLQSVSDDDFGSATGDIACDSYHKMDEDINLLKELGVSCFTNLLLYNGKKYKNE